MRCFSRVLIFNIHKSIIALIFMNSLDTHFSRNVFEAVQKTRSTCFIGSKTSRLLLVVLNPIKHSCSFFKHYVKVLKNSFRFVNTIPFEIHCLFLTRITDGYQRVCSVRHDFVLTVNGGEAAQKPHR